MTAFDPGISLNCLHSHCAMVPVSAAHVIWQALAAYAVAGPCLTQACRELPAPVPQGCGVVVGDLQFMYIATLVALTAGIVVPFSLTRLCLEGFLLSVLKDRANETGQPQSPGAASRIPPAAG